ncbi:hypothetical protein H9X96_17465 [Pedobacter sp. N36a]|uniref:hypothetical protein n=1 Tax=Pedobacter sp. N36a TaxID=2767996 RepID=UPI00165696B5|nr:hypothetical protein [Pedobacter sp. N36a]MBC8987561.1 hypothetical protein [Pedobacter sp. N36a]
MLKVVKKERKKRYNNEIDRKQAVRITKAKYQRQYRQDQKVKKKEEEARFSNVTYQNDIYNSIKDLDFNYQITLRFNKFTSIECATSAAQYFIKRLGNGITNVVSTPEYGADHNVHMHLAIQFSKQFLFLYTDDKLIKNYLYSIWNNNKRRNGAVWVGQFLNEIHKKNYLKYMFKQVLPQSQWHYKQKQVDLYHIHAFDIPTRINDCMNILNTVLNKANSVPTINCIGIANTEAHMEKIMRYRGFKSLMTKYKYQAVTIVMAAVWMLLI